MRGEIEAIRASKSKAKAQRDNWKARYVALEAALRDDRLADCAQKARSCIGLLNSMVRSGETHSETSCRMLVEALEALDAIAVYRAWLLALIDDKETT